MSLQHEIDIRIDDPGWEKLNDLDALVQRTVLASLKNQYRQNAACGLSIVFANDEAVRTLNKQWRGKDKPTNILSFPAAPGTQTDSGLTYIGDLILAREVVEREAAAQGKALATHLCHLIVHGVLHLLGHDHQSDKEAEDMESCEIAIMAGLGYGNPYQPDR